MIKFIKTEGNTDQDIQDYLDYLVDGGAKARDGLKYSARKHNYAVLCESNWKYAGIDNNGGTFLSSNISNFVDHDDVDRLLKIESLAKELVTEIVHPHKADMKIGEIANQLIEVFNS